MSGQVLSFSEAQHRQVDGLLPWYVNGSLSEPELARVNEHLQVCERCRQELVWLRGLDAAYQSSDDQVDAAPAFARLRQQLAPPHAAGTPRRWQSWVMVAQLALIAVLATVALMQAQSGAEYRTLAASGSTLHPSGSLVVMFAPQTSVAAVGSLLRGLGARVIDGPTASNAYVLRVLPGRQVQVLAALHREHSVVLAQALTGGSAR